MTAVTLGTGTINNTRLSNATWTANTTEKNSRNDTSDTLHIKITSWLDTNAKNAITTESNCRNMTSAILIPIVTHGWEMQHGLLIVLNLILGI